MTFACDRVGEDEPSRMKHRAIDLDRLADSPVQVIADHIVTNRSEMYPDLMGSSCFETTAQPGDHWTVFAALNHLIVRASVASRSGDGHTGAPRCRPPYRSIDHAPVVVDPTPNQGLVMPLDRALGERRNERLIRRLSSGHNKKTAGAAVEAMDDAGTQRIADISEFGEVGEQTVDHRRIGVTGARVNHQPNGLVHHQHMLIGMDHRDANSWISDRRNGLGGFRRLKGNNHPLVEPE